MPEACFTVDGQVLVVNGSLIKIGRLKRELYRDIRDPSGFLSKLENAGTSIDIFTFLNVFPQTAELLPYPTEWDNVAAIQIESVEKWRKDLPRGTKRALRRADEAKIDVRCVTLDDALVHQIKEIFDESPVRQGRPFWHYGKSFEAAKEMLSRDLDESTFLGAYWQGELIGFVKLIRAANFARMALFLGKIRHRFKGVNNILIAKSVEFCVANGIPYLIYGQMDYGKVGSQTLAEFKANNGFRKMPIARYYAPLTAKGRLALKLGLHHGMLALCPRPVVRAALAMRTRWYARKAAPIEQVESAPEQRRDALTAANHESGPITNTADSPAPAHRSTRYGLDSAR